ncbi:MAG: hypothetical protein IJ347_00685 [Faecalibacterium sp.]|nr:hypothetical protein [Faecalibacterium sp.]
MNKSRASLLLMEQLVMVLVFALSAAICLQVFVKADEISRMGEQTDRAVLLAQTGAETIKGCKGDLQRAAGLLQGQFADRQLCAVKDDLCLKAQHIDTVVAGLGQAEIWVEQTDTGQRLFTLTVAWQEVSG